MSQRCWTMRLRERGAVTVSFSYLALTAGPNVRMIRPRNQRQNFSSVVVKPLGRRTSMCCEITAFVVGARTSRKVRLIVP